MKSEDAMTADKNSGLDSLESAYQELLRGEEGFIALEKGSELSWLRRARERDAARWRAEGLPKRSSERWRYTNLNAIENSRVVLAERGELPDRSVFPRLPGAAVEIAFLNGVFVPEWSHLPFLPAVTISVLSRLFEECVANGWSKERLHHLKEFRDHLENSDADRETVFASMNTSFLQDGVLVSLDADGRLEGPIAIYNFNLANGHAGELAMASPRVFVHLGRGAEAAVAEVSVSLGDGRSLSNSVCDLRLDEGARLSHARVQKAGGPNLQIATTRVKQGRDSFCETFHFALGGELIRHDLHIGLEGPGAEAALDGLYLLEGREQADNYTFVEHAHPRTSSSQLYKGILAGESRGIFHGAVHIFPDAQKSSAAQLNKNLMLSPKAEVDTRPELTIDADDVKASHGATIGRMDGDQIFYLQTRAIGKNEAERILARGFGMDIALRIRHSGLREMMRGFLAQRFATYVMGGADV